MPIRNAGECGRYGWPGNLIKNTEGRDAAATQQAAQPPSLTHAFHDTARKGRVYDVGDAGFSSEQVLGAGGRTRDQSNLTTRRVLRDHADERNVPHQVANAAVRMHV